MTDQIDNSEEGKEKILEAQRLFTKGRRREIYLELAERVKDTNHLFVCVFLESYINPFLVWSIDLSHEFPEFALFRPFELYDDAEAWFTIGHGVSDPGLTRHIALLLCAEMCDSRWS